MPKKKSILLEGLKEIKPPKVKLPKIKPIDKLILGEIREEKKRVPQSVKTKVYERAGGKCEWPRCRKRLKRSEGEFHHWGTRKHSPTERTTAFLCHMHHRDKRYKTHSYKVETDMLGNKTVRIVRKRIPITTKKKPTKRKTKKVTKTRKKTR